LLRRLLRTIIARRQIVAVIVMFHASLVTKL
jgi:hypothetical protein